MLWLRISIRARCTTLYFSVTCGRSWFSPVILLPNFQSSSGSWPWSYGSWIYNYLCNQCLSPLMLWVQISIRARCTTLYLSVTCGRSVVFPGHPVSCTNKTDRHDITEMLLKVALNTMKPYQSLFHSFTDLASFHSSRSHSDVHTIKNRERTRIVWSWEY
jgi:hypothetical protein